MIQGKWPSDPNILEKGATFIARVHPKNWFNETVTKDATKSWEQSLNLVSFCVVRFKSSITTSSAKQAAIPLLSWKTNPHRLSS